MFRSGREPLIINDAMTHPDTCHMQISQDFQIKSFLGVPIFRKNGELFGNLCCFDKVTYHFTNEDVLLLQTLSTFMTYVIELEIHNTNKEMDYERLYNENKLVLDSLSEGVFGMDLDGLVTFCNPSTLKLVDYASEDLIGISPFSTFLKGKIGDKTNLFLTLQDGQTRTQDNGSFCRRNGSFFPVEYTSSAVIENEEIVGVVVTFRDVTEEKQAEELMLKSEKLKLAGQLAAGISHEVRNPLTAIKGFFQLIKTTGMNDDYFKIIDDELSRIEDISGELLILAKPQTNTYQENELHQLIKEVVLLLETQAILKSIKINTFNLNDNLWIHCDKSKIKQVLINLIKNAIEVMDTGVITIQVSRSAEEAIIMVTDDGPGIPADRLHKIGEPFYSTKEKGTGLGLLTSYKIIEHHKGSIQVKSQVGEGTTFTVSLPLT
ncbi:MAG: PAS domain S-box protein [Bacillaceae bacterium]|nr:PAS domain S-box protein [Bacillaceae bacterium]